MLRFKTTTVQFLSTPSGWRATPGRNPGCGQHPHFYPRPPGGGRRIPCKRLSGHIHFYPRPPGGGRPGQPSRVGTRVRNFYPRPPGGGRPPGLCRNIRVAYFYPRPPGGGRHRLSSTLFTKLLFLSTPSGWRATFPTAYYSVAVRFLSTPSGWRATAKTDKVFICFCAKGRRICLFKTRKEKNLPVAF